MMPVIEKMGLNALHRFDPDAAHGLAIRALRAGLAPAPRKGAREGTYWNEWGAARPD